MATVNTENQTLSQIINSNQVGNLPTLTRNPYDLVATSGNVSEDMNSGRGAGYAINGARSADTDVLLDGGENVTCLPPPWARAFRSIPCRNSAC